jgi:hypothetical protein
VNCEDDTYHVSDIRERKGMIGTVKVIRHHHILEKSTCGAHAELFISSTSIDEEH